MTQIVRHTVGNFLPAPKDQFDHGNNASTVMLIPGFTQGSGSMSQIGKALSEKHNVVYVGNLSWYTANVKALTAQILEKYRAVQKNEKNHDISLVGHSFGGVLGVVLLSDTPDVRMNQLITVGTPHDKVPLATLVPGIPAIQELEEDIYRSRPKIQKRQLNRFTTIAAGNDIIVPTDSQHGKFAPISSKIPTQHEVWDEYGHLCFLDSKGAKRIVKLLD